MDANIGNEWVHPSLDTTALQCKPCELKADTQNSQYVHLEIFEAVLQNLDYIFSCHHC